ncbi:MAG: hypothetical protein IPL61_18745 [Myxococcales bacterium]|nr:hypothetical protein [Myxococcales bacterium]
MAHDTTEDGARAAREERAELQRWMDVGAALRRAAPELFESMVRAAEVTAVAILDAHDAAGHP